VKATYWQHARAVETEYGERERECALAPRSVHRKCILINWAAISGPLTFLSKCWAIVLDVISFHSSLFFFSFSHANYSKKICINVFIIINSARLMRLGG
jgi:hypothetical protein